MRSLIATLLLLTVAGSLVIGAAAGHAVNANELAVGSAPVAACDTDGVFVDYELDLDSGAFIESVRISDVAPPCIGQTMSVRLTTAGDVTLWSTELVVYSSSMDIPVTAPVDASAAADITIVISGHVPIS